MKVLIVAKTRMGSGACIGGITFDGRSVRLIAHDKEFNDHFNMEYNVGDVWEVETVPDPAIVPPHVENVIVTSKRRLPPMDDIMAMIERHMPAKSGGLEALYEGLTQATKAGVLYIAERSGIPPYSTMFWRPDQPLVRDDDAKRIRYRYPAPGGGRTLTFVGFQEPVGELPAGTLLRVSLAHWWRPAEMPEGELRCYLQLSGWFLEPERTQPRAMPAGQEARPAWQGAVVGGPRAVLKRVFGFDDFLPLQAEVIDNLLDQRDTLAVMPTGSGKSLCYQLPAMLLPGLTVVASPLIALMQDQVRGLRETGVPAAALNSAVPYPEYLSITNRVRSGAIKLLYAAPETLLRPEVLLLLQNCQVDCLTIDEAHCISEWGHDFRPEYRQLAELRRRLPEATCLAVTATATERVRQDIKRNLGIVDADEFVASFNRPNLHLAVARRHRGQEQTLAFLQEHRDESGIIYCATRKRVDSLVALLRANGWQAAGYHAGMDNGARRQSQEQFIRDDVPIMVATVAFGMGIDKSNVRFILHYDLPPNLESYYQQIGRAGRDGLPATCLLLYSFADVKLIRRFIDEAAPSQRAGAEARLQAMLDFAATAVCRRRPLLAYFGESYQAEQCGFCDNCQGEEGELVDLTVPAQKFLSCVKRTGELFGSSHIISVLRGSRSKKVLQWGHHRLSTYGIGREFSVAAWQSLARQLVQRGMLERDMDHGHLKLTDRGWSVLRGETFKGRPPEEPERLSQSMREGAVTYDTALFERLRARRKELADAAGLPPYVIFSDRTLAEMALYYPQSLASFAALTGVGAIKLEKYAGDFLPLIQDYCQRRGIQERPWGEAPPARRTRQMPASGRTVQVVEQFRGGLPVPEIAAQLGIKASTVLDHLWRGMQAGHEVPERNLATLSQLSQAEQERVLQAFASLGVARLKPVFDALGESVSYDELHLWRMIAVCRHPPLLQSAPD